MSSMNTQTVSDMQLRGDWLALARLGWLAVAALTLTLFIAALPLRYEKFQEVCMGAACVEPQLTLDDVRELQALGLSRSFHAAYHIGLETTFALVHAVIAGVIFVRRSNDRMALFVALMLLTFGVATFTGTLNALAAPSSAWRLPVSALSSLPGTLPDWLWQPPALWRLPVALLSAIGQVSVALFFYLFPSGGFVPRWTRWLAIVWIAWQVPAAFWPGTLLNAERWPPLLAGTVWATFLSSYVFAQLYRYRHVSDTGQRMQTKWVVFGVTGALSGFLLASLLASIVSTFAAPAFLYREAITAFIYLSMLMIPLSFGMAILRFNLWAIDAAINRTLVYGVLTVTLALAYTASVVLLQQVFRFLIGQTSNLAIVVSTLAIAVLFNPLRRRVQGTIDRRFYRQKYNAAQTLTAFSARLRDEVDLDRLKTDLLAVVEETMQPAHVSLWLRGPGQENGD
jgi:hypothetical protein